MFNLSFVILDIDNVWDEAIIVIQYSLPTFLSSTGKEMSILLLTPKPIDQLMRTRAIGEDGPLIIAVGCHDCLRSTVWHCTTLPEVYLGYLVCWQTQQPKTPVLETEMSRLPGRSDYLQFEALLN